MSDWTECTLGDVITLQRGFDLPHRKRNQGSVPIVSSSGITGEHDVPKVPGPGVITGRYGTLGEVFYIERDFWPLNTTLFVKDFKGNDPRYVSYLLKTLNLVEQNVAGAVPGVNRNYVHMLEVRIPEIVLQRKISKLLSVYDRLLKTNERKITLLEEMAQRIYREWFVDFKFPGHEKVKMVDSGHPDFGMIPEGWKVENLFDICDIGYGFPFKSSKFNTEGNGTKVVRIRDILHSTSKTYSAEAVDDRYLINEGDLLIGMDGIFHMGNWSDEASYLVQRVARVRPREVIYNGFISIALQRPIKNFENSLVGTTVAHLGDKHLRMISIVVPPSSFVKDLSNILEYVIVLKKKNRNLVSMRDLLLPKLISGELDVSNINIDLNINGE